VDLQWQAQVVGMDVGCSEPAADLPSDKKRNVKTGVTSMRSQVLHWAAQGEIPSLYYQLKCLCVLSACCKSENVKLLSIKM